MESAVFFLAIGLLIGAAAAIVAAALAYERGRRAGRMDLLDSDWENDVAPTPICFCAVRDRRDGLDHEQERRVPRYGAGLAVAFALAGAAAWPAPAVALQINATCFTEAQRDRTLKDEYLERMVGNVSVSDGLATGIAELWIAKETTTIMLVLPSGRNCVVFIGGRWRWVAPEQGEVMGKRIAE